MSLPAVPVRVVVATREGERRTVTLLVRSVIRQPERPLRGRPNRLSLGLAMSHHATRVGTTIEPRNAETPPAAWLQGRARRFTCLSCAGRTYQLVNSAWLGGGFLGVDAVLSGYVSLVRGFVQDEDREFHDDCRLQPALVVMLLGSCLLSCLPV